MRLDLRIDNANVLTMDPAHPVAGSVGVWNGLVVALDGDAAAMAAAQVVDAAGATVLPGFIDAHTHLCWAGLEAGATDISAASSIDEALALISAAAAGAPDGTWVDVAGYDQRALGRHLTSTDLDRVRQGRPVYVQHRSGHVCVVSSDVLAQLPDGWLAPNREGVDIGPYGQPTGVLAEAAMRGVRSAISRCRARIASSNVMPRALSRPAAGLLPSPTTAASTIAPSICLRRDCWAADAAACSTRSNSASGRGSVPGSARMSSRRPPR